MPLHVTHDITVRGSNLYAAQNNPAYIHLCDANESSIGLLVTVPVI